MEPYSSDGRGTNVVIVRSPMVHRLVRQAMADHRLDLMPVDQEFIVETQAAGLRHRREGLAYRLKIAPPRIPLRKRVAPGGQALPLRRKLVYRARYLIGRWSHRIAALAHRWRVPGLYVGWARVALHLYQAITYLRGPLGRMIALVERLDRRVTQADCPSG